MRRIVLASLLGLSCALWSGGETTILRLAGAQEPKPARVMELVHSQADGASQVLVRVEGAVTHRTERLNNPPRVALDLVGATPAMKMGTLLLKDPRIRQIRSSLYRTDPSTVRVVFDLVAPTEFQVRAVEGGVLVVFSETGVAKGPMPVPAPKAEASKPSAPSAAGTPPPRVRTPTPAPTPGPQMAQQAPQAPTPAPAPPARRSQNKLISMDFKDADIHNLLRILAEFSGVNVVAGDDVKGKVTVRLNNVPWDQALDAVVKGAGMAYVREGNIVRVGKLESLSKEAQEQIKLDQAEEESKFRREQRRIQIEQIRREDEAKWAPLQEEIIRLRYAQVGTRKVELLSFHREGSREQELKGVEEGITGGVKKEPGKPAGFLSERGSIVVDERTNSMIVRDVSANIEAIKKFIETVDTPLPTIQIDARIVEINRDDAIALGIQWGGVLTPQLGRNAPVVTTRGNTGPGGTSVVDLLPPLTGAATGLAVGVIASNFALDAALRALEDRGKANVVSRPSVVTQQNQPATVASGEQIPVFSTTVTQAGFLQTTVTFKDVTTRIQVIPRVTSGSQIALTVGIKKEEVIEILREPGIAIPRISTRQGVTSLIIENGQTGVIGGLQVENRSERERGVPFLSRIPILGWLFKNHTDDSSVKELMIFVTARILETSPKAALAPSSAPSASNPPTEVPPAGGQSPSGSPAPSEQAPASAPAVPSGESKTPAYFVPDERSELWR